MNLKIHFQNNVCPCLLTNWIIASRNTFAIFVNCASEVPKDVDTEMCLNRLRRTSAQNVHFFLHAIAILEPSLCKIYIDIFGKQDFFKIVRWIFVSFYGAGETVENTAESIMKHLYKQWLYRLVWLVQPINIWNTS